MVATGFLFPVVFSVAVLFFTLVFHFTARTGVAAVVSSAFLR